MTWKQQICNEIKNWNKQFECNYFLWWCVCVCVWVSVFIVVQQRVLVYVFQCVQKSMQNLCKKYAKIMYKSMQNLCKKYAKIMYKSMQKSCKKYAKKYAQGMQKVCNVQLGTVEVFFFIGKLVAPSRPHHPQQTPPTPPKKKNCASARHGHSKERRPRTPSACSQSWALEVFFYFFQ